MVLNPAVEHRIIGLVNQKSRPSIPLADLGRLPGLIGGIAADSNIQRFALLDCRVERPQSFLQGCVRIKPMAVKDVEVINTDAFQRLVQAGDQILAGPPLAIGAGPHVIPRLGRDQQFVTRQILQDFSNIDFSATVRWTIIVG